MKQILITFLLISVAFAVFPLPASAIILVPCGRTPTTGKAPGDEPGTKPCQFRDLIVLLIRVVNYMISVAAIVAMYHILAGGFGFITALGESEKIQRAKDTISNAVVGFAMIILAFVFVNLVVNGILGTVNGGGGYRRWWDLNCIYDINETSCYTTKYNEVQGDK